MSTLLKYLFKLCLLLTILIGLFALAGVLPQFIDTFKDVWWQAQARSTDIETLKYSLSTHLLKGPTFYYLVLTSIVIFFRQKLFRLYRKEVSFYIFLVFVLGWLYFFNHARPFVFMTCAADLMGALLITMAIHNSWRVFVKSYIFFAGLLIATAMQFSNNPYFFYEHMHLNRDGYVLKSTIDFPERAKSLLPADHKLFDPVGLLYYATPCTKEWYLDTPHSDQVAKKRWLVGLDLSQCTHVIQSTQSMHFEFEILYEFGEYFETLEYPLSVKRASF